MSEIGLSNCLSSTKSADFVCTHLVADYWWLNNSSDQEIAMIMLRSILIYEKLRGKTRICSWPVCFVVVWIYRLYEFATWKCWWRWRQLIILLLFSYTRTWTAICLFIYLYNVLFDDIINSGKDYCQLQRIRLSLITVRWQRFHLIDHHPLGHLGRRTSAS